MEDLVERMLQLASLEKRSSLDATESIDIRDLLEGINRDFQVEILKRELRIRIECQSGLRARAEPFLIRQALSNLLQNAITNFNHRGKGYQVAAGYNLMMMLAAEGLDEIGTTVMRSNSRMQRLMISRGWLMKPDDQDPDLIRGVLRLDTLKSRHVA